MKAVVFVASICKQALYSSLTCSPAARAPIPAPPSNPARTRAASHSAATTSNPRPPAQRRHIRCGRMGGSSIDDAYLPFRMLRFTAVLFIGGLASAQAHSGGSAADIAPLPRGVFWGGWWSGGLNQRGVWRGQIAVLNSNTSNYPSNRSNPHSGRGAQLTPPARARAHTPIGHVRRAPSSVPRVPPTNGRARRPVS